MVLIRGHRFSSIGAIFMTMRVKGEREACQYYRFEHRRENLCSPSENWYFEYLDEADPDATTIMLRGA